MCPDEDGSIANLPPTPAKGGRIGKRARLKTRSWEKGERNVGQKGGSWYGTGVTRAKGSKRRVLPAKYFSGGMDRLVRSGKRGDPWTPPHNCRLRMTSAGTYKREDARCEGGGVRDRPRCEFASKGRVFASGAGKSAKKCRVKRGGQKKT